MYILEGKSTRAQLRQQEEVEMVLQELMQLGYIPTLRTGAQSMLTAAGVEAPFASRGSIAVLSGLLGGRPIRDAIVGDIFFEAEHAFILHPTDSELAVWEIRNHTSESELDALCESVATSAQRRLDGRRLRGMEFSWTPASLPESNRWFRPHQRTKVPRGRQTPELKNQQVTLTEEDTYNAELLVNADRRTFLQRLNQLGKARSVDAQADIDQELVQPLLDGYIISREYLVLCKQDSHTLCTVESRQELEGERGTKFRCSLCGRPFAEEQIQEVYAPTSRARELLSHSHWMTLWVTNLIVRAGLSTEAIAWSATAGEDELDIVATIQDQKIFFELKDREFGLGDAYPFSSRVQRYGGAAGVIITTDKVADEVKNYLQEQERTSSGRIYTLEGPKEIEEDLPQVLSEFAQRTVLGTINDFFEDNEIRADILVRQWLR